MTQDTTMLKNHSKLRTAVVTERFKSLCGGIQLHAAETWIVTGNQMLAIKTSNDNWRQAEVPHCFPTIMYLSTTDVCDKPFTTLPSIEWRWINAAQWTLFVPTLMRGMWSLIHWHHGIMVAFLSDSWKLALEQLCMKEWMADMHMKPNTWSGTSKENTTEMPPELISSKSIWYCSWFAFVITTQWKTEKMLSTRCKPTEDGRRKAKDAAPETEDLPSYMSCDDAVSLTYPSTYKSQVRLFWSQSRKHEGDPGATFILNNQRVTDCKALSVSK